MKRIWGILMVIMALCFLPLSTMAQQTAPAGADSAKQAEGGGEHQHDAAPSQESSKPAQQGYHEKMAEHCKAMMEKRQEALKEIEAMDGVLDEKIAAMNSAKGDKKIEAMAAVITEMAAQRKVMREKLSAAHRCPMCPMMGHGMKGHPGMHGQKGMMGECPMMKKHGSAPQEKVMSQ